jgi:hypothetical protein
MKPKQVDRRTAADRRDYMTRYHARRIKGTAKPLPQPRQRAQAPPDRLPFVQDGCHLRDGSGRMMWPDRRNEFPESIKQSLRRMK